MYTIRAMLSMMPFRNRSSIITYFGFHFCTVFFICNLYFTWFTNQTFIFWFRWSPFSTISTPAALTNHVHIYCITDILFCTTDFIAVQIIITNCFPFIIHVPPGTAFIIYIHNISLHFRKRRVITNDFLRLDTPQHFIVACQKPFLLIFTVIML